MESREAVNIILSRVLLLTLLFSTSIWTLPFAIPSAIFSNSPENDLLASNNSSNTDEKHEMKSKEEGVAETKGNLLNLNPISVNSPVENNSLNSSENREETSPENVDLSKLLHDSEASSPSPKLKRELSPQQPPSSPNIDLNDTNSGKEKPPEISSDTGQIANASTRPASRIFKDHEVSNDVEATNHLEPKRLPLEFVTTNRVYLTLLGDYDDAVNKRSGLDNRKEKLNDFENDTKTSPTIFLTLVGDTDVNKDELSFDEQSKLNDSHSQANVSSEAQDQEARSKEQENPLEEKTDLDSETDSTSNSTTESQPVILELYDSPAFYGRNIDIQDDFQVFEDRGCVDFSCKDDS